jgi:AcrR family transcriptional regulator
MKRKITERRVEATIRNETLVSQRREEIIQAASQVFSKKGYHQATIKDICEVSGLGPGTIYNYVKKKEDILFLIYDKLTTALDETLLEAIKNNKGPLDQLRESLRKTIDIVWDNQDLILLMYQETAALDRESMYNILHRESNYVKHMKRILEMGSEKGFLCNKNTRMAADIIVYLLAFIPLRRWNLRGRFGEKEIKSGLIDFILKALCIRDRRNRR